MKWSNIEWNVLQHFFLFPNFFSGCQAPRLCFRISLFRFYQWFLSGTLHQTHWRSKIQSKMGKYRMVVHLPLESQTKTSVFWMVGIQMVKTIAIALDMIAMVPNIQNTNHSKSDLQNVRFSNVSSFKRVRFWIPAVFLLWHSNLNVQLFVPPSLKRYREWIWKNELLNWGYS